MRVQKVFAVAVLVTVFALAADAVGQAAVHSAGGSRRGGGMGVAPSRNNDRPAASVRVGDRFVVTRNLPRERLEAHYGPSDRNIMRTNGGFVEIPKGTVVEVFAMPRHGGARRGWVLEVVPVRMGELTRPGELRSHFVPARFVTHDFRYYTIQVNAEYLGVELVPEDGAPQGVAAAPGGQAEQAKTDVAVPAPAPAPAISAADQARQRFIGSWYIEEGDAREVLIFDFHQNGTVLLETYASHLTGIFNATWDVVDGRAIVSMRNVHGHERYDTLMCYFRNDTLIVSETVSDDGSTDGPALTRLSTAADRAALVARAWAGMGVDRAAIANMPIDMVFVKGGTFRMGCTAEQGRDCEESERPVRSVTVGDFYIGKYEVTQAQWVQVMGSNPIDTEEYRIAQNIMDNMPVYRVAWDDVQIFISRLNAATGKNYRLPTEAEWEYAARGGNKSRGFKYSGGNNIADVASCGNHRINDLLAVGSKQANELGIHDMSGNVSEWISEFYASYPGGAPIHEELITSRATRGGDITSLEKECRVSSRNCAASHVRGHIGFRLVLDPEGKR